LPSEVFDGTTETFMHIAFGGIFVVVASGLRKSQYNTYRSGGAQAYRRRQR
jgi:hypothetical protein